MTEQDYYAAWVSMHSTRDVRQMEPLDLVGAFLLLPPPAVGPEQWVRMMGEVEHGMHEARQERERGMTQADMAQANADALRSIRSSGMGPAVRRVVSEEQEPTPIVQE